MGNLDTNSLRKLKPMKRGLRVCKAFQRCIATYESTSKLLKQPYCLTGFCNVLVLYTANTLCLNAMRSPNNRRI